MLSIIRKIADYIDAFNEVIGKGVSWLTVFMVINVFVIVVLRYVLHEGWIWMQELYIWIHSTVFLLGAGYTLLHDGHVRIDLIYRSASKKYKAIVNIIGSIFLAFPLIYVLYDRSYPIVIRSWLNLEGSAEAGGLPGVFLLKTVISVFCIVFGFQIISLFLRSILVLIDGENISSKNGEAR